MSDLPRDAALIRPGGPADAGPCAVIVNDWIDATPWMPRVHDHADIARFFHETFPKRTVLIAERAGRITGYLSLTDESLVAALYLAPAERGQGTGKRLLDAAKAARPGGLSLWAFRHNLGARRFYAREGFTEVRRTDGDNEENLPDILFAWTPEG